MNVMKQNNRCHQKAAWKNRRTDRQEVILRLRLRSEPGEEGGGRICTKKGIAWMEAFMQEVA
jgi:hypothetical protein